MKKNILIFLFGLLLNSSNIFAQSWLNGGNALTANGSLGTTTNFSFLFKTNNAERGRITNGGFWGFGTATPNAKVHINGTAGQVPLRVENNGFTKLLVNNGVTIGTNLTPPTNGLFVLGNTGLGTASPANRLHVFNGSAGVAPFSLAPLIVESSTHNYINILAPNDFETGILFGNPAQNTNGGIIYNSAGTPGGFQFRADGNHLKMILDRNGKLGLNTAPGQYMLKIIPDFGARGLDLQNPQTNNDWELFPGGGPLEVWFNNNFRGSFSSTSGAYSSISDERLKTNINPMGAMLEKIRQLKPSTYQFKNATDKQDYNGFIAQDVMKLFPGMVTHNVNPERNLDIYTMDYSQFGVLAIKGIQELLPVVEKQKEQIATLEDRLAKLEAAFKNIAAIKNENISIVNNNELLQQNQPNPFAGNTTIRYTIPKGNKGAINIYDQTGKTIKTFEVFKSGGLQLDGYNLAAGIYTYSLTVNDKLVTSKQMLIIK